MQRKCCLEEGVISLLKVQDPEVRFQRPFNPIRSTIALYIKHTIKHGCPYGSRINVCPSGSFRMLSDKILNGRYSSQSTTATFRPLTPGKITGKNRCYHRAFAHTAFLIAEGDKNQTFVSFYSCFWG